MPASGPGDVEPHTLDIACSPPVDVNFAGAGLAHADAIRRATISMLRLHAALGGHSQVQADRSPQEGHAVREDYERRDGKAGDSPLPVRRKREGPPTGEGYCPNCHFIVGTYRRRLMEHAGYWALWVGGAVHKSPEMP